MRVVEGRVMAFLLLVMAVAVAIVVVAVAVLAAGSFDPSGDGAGIVADGQREGQRARRPPYARVLGVSAEREPPAPQARDLDLQARATRVAFEDELGGLPPARGLEPEGAGGDGGAETSDLHPHGLPARVGAVAVGGQREDAADLELVA